MRRSQYASSQQKGGSIIKGKIHIEEDLELGKSRKGSMPRYGRYDTHNDYGIKPSHTLLNKKYQNSQANSIVALAKDEMASLDSYSILPKLKQTRQSMQSSIFKDPNRMSVSVLGGSSEHRLDTSTFSNQHNIPRVKTNLSRHK